MTRRVPALPTLVVLMAVAAMVGLGVWQLHRKAWKEQLLATYAANAGKPAIAWPARLPASIEPFLFRRAAAICQPPIVWRALQGDNRAGRSGWKHVASCRIGAEGEKAVLDMGWSLTPDSPIAWRGGGVSGVIDVDRLARIRLVADTPAPGLQPSAAPSPASIPNNHLSYAVQWFIFAALAPIIYGIALARRNREAGP